MFPLIFPLHIPLICSPCMCSPYMFHLHVPLTCSPYMFPLYVFPLHVPLTCSPYMFPIYVPLYVPLLSHPIIILTSTVEPLSKGHFGPAILSLVERLSSFQRLKCIAYTLLGILEVSFVERLSLSRRVLYWRFHCIAVIHYLYCPNRYQHRIMDLIVEYIC